MSKLIRLYENTRQLSSIETELRAGRFNFAVVTGSVASRSGSTLDESILAALGSAGVSGSQMSAYLDAIKKGGAAVSVKSEFGFGGKAASILDKYGPSRSGVSSSAGATFDKNSATPFSNLIRAPVLLDNSGDYKSYSGTPLLLDSDKLFSGTPLLVKSNLYISGRPLLLDSEGPYKSFSGKPLLIDDKKVFSGTPLLINNPTPLSTWLGLPVLWK
jgi:hypothetical protein